MQKKVTRLYRYFQPELYELDLVPSKDKMSFSGKVVISGKKTGPPSGRLTFHQKDLKISKAKITKLDKKGEKDLRVSRINTQDKFNEVRLHSSETLYGGYYKVEIEFSGNITDHMHGMYPGYFDNRKKKIISTQFESHHAREVFPSIDEPEAKAVFELTLRTPTDETVISNTPVKKQLKKADLLITKFEPTPKMSTYLLAFVYGELKYKEAKTTDGVLVRVYATPKNIKHADFALQTAVKCLEFYNDYFDIAYPLPKLDMVALPDFNSGAMENWGLVTYREQVILADEKNTSIETKQYIGIVIAHELAHQWFGNLVTMRWWTDLWLNEGFASWIEYLATDKLFPKWHMWTQFIVNDQITAQRLDALENTHPIEVEVKHPDEIQTIFDLISYQKGASVIHMLYGYLGEADFKKGLRHYLKQHAYGNATTEDLWKALEDDSGKPVREFMHKWVSTPGFPVLSVKSDSDAVKVSQERFFIQKPKTKPDLFWPIPLNSSDLQDQGLLKTPSAELLSKTKAPLLNDGHSGFYNTIYDAAAYKIFGRKIETGKLSEANRLGLLSDAFSAAKAGYLPTAQALDLLGYFHTEHSAPVWDIIAGVISDIRRVFDEPQLLDDMKPYLRKITNDQFERLGWKHKKDEPHFDTLLRSSILALASVGNNQKVVAEALDRFKKMNQPEDEHPDIRSVIYQTAAREGDSVEFSKMLGFYKKTSSADELITLAAGLTSFKQPLLQTKALELLKTDAVRNQDCIYWIAFSFGNRYSKKLAWEWVKQNWQWLDDNFKGDIGFSRLPLYAARSFSKLSFKKDYSSFFEPLLKPAIAREYNQGLETIDWQSAWRKRDLSILDKFFKLDQ